MILGIDYLMDHLPQQMEPENSEPFLVAHPECLVLIVLLKRLV
jgi:hypothetical protein